MKIKYKILFFLFAFVLINAKTPQQEAITKTLTAERGGTLKVKVNPGDVNIKIWERNEVLVKIDGLDDDELKELEVTSRSGNVTVSYDGRWGRSAKYHFTIPAKYNVDIYTTGGDVFLQDNLDGNLNIQTMGGDIDLLSITGDAKLETMGGDITLKNIGGQSYISTQGGDIEIGKLAGGAREVKTMGGDIDIEVASNVKNVTTYGGDIKIGKATDNIKIVTFGGNIEIMNCDAGINAETYGGSVFVNGANGLVDVSSGGGNLTLKNIKGAVKARTGAGDIEVELKADSNSDSDIRTSAGDIQLVVLPGSKMTITAKVDSYWGEDKGLIKSDFEGRISKNRGDMNGEFKINGGGAEIKLRAENGTITIIKK